MIAHGMTWCCAPQISGRGAEGRQGRSWGIVQPLLENVNRGATQRECATEPEHPLSPAHFPVGCTSNHDGESCTVTTSVGCSVPSVGSNTNVVMPAPGRREPTQPSCPGWKPVYEPTYANLLAIVARMVADVCETVGTALAWSMCSLRVTCALQYRVAKSMPVCPANALNRYR